MSKICLIDGDILLYSTCYSNINIDDFYFVKYSFLTTMHNILSSTGTCDYIGFLTSKTNFRKDVKISLDKAYKGNRKKELPKWFFELKDWLTNDLGFITIDTLEADDCLSIYSRYSSDCVIVSTDKDLLQIVGNHYNPNTSVFRRVDKEEAKLNLWIQVLMGDSTDNVSGIRGVGKVKAAQILSNCPFRQTYESTVLEKYISSYGEYEGMEKFYKTYVYVKLLENHNNLVPKDICIRQLDYRVPVESTIGLPSINDITIDGYRE